MRKLYLGILYAVTLVCVLAGIGIHVGRWAINGFTFLKNSKVSTTSASVDLDGSYDSIDIKMDCDLGDIKIRRGDKFAINYDENDSIKVKVEQDANTLNIIQNSSTQKVSNFNDLDLDIELTIPTGMNINTLTVDIKLGDVKIEGVDIKNCTIVENLGEVKLKDCFGFEALNISNDLGDIELENCGNWNEYDVNLSVSLGDIKYYGNKYSDSYVVNNNSGKTLKINDSLGSIKIK